MPNLKQIALLLLRLALAFGAMLIAYTLGFMVIGDTGVVMTPEETAQAGRGLLGVALVSSLILSFLVIRSPWRGLKLIAALFVVQFGIETFMTQIETLYFNDAVQMENAMLVGIVAAGALRALIFAPLAVIIFGKLRQPPVEDRLPTPPLPPNWIRRFVALSFFYVLVYFVFGYFVAWQWEATRVYYTGAAEIKPFFTHIDRSLSARRLRHRSLPTAARRAVDRAGAAHCAHDDCQTLASLAGSGAQLLVAARRAADPVPQSVHAAAGGAVSFR